MLTPHLFAVVIRASRQRRIVPRLINSSSALALALAIATSPALAASSTWSSTATSGAWQSTGNWIGGTVPGATSGTTNTDTATFNNAGNGQSSIIPDPGRNLENITFDTAAAAYTIGTTGGNALVLTSVGQTQIASTFSGSNVTETINAPLVLEGGGCTFANNVAKNDLLLLGGPITSGAAGTQTLVVSGNGNTTIGGAIGGGTGTITLQMNATGTLALNGSNTFTGGVAINSGTLVLGNVNALGSTGPITTVANGATLDLAGQQLGAGPPLTIHGAGVGGNGALISSAPLSLATYDGTINSGNPSSFTVGGTGDIDFLGGFNAPNTLTKVGTNTLYLAGTSDNGSLSLNVNGGTVVLQKTSSPTVHAVEGNSLSINSGLVQLAGTGGDQIPDNSYVAVNGSGAAFDTNGRNETIGVLDLGGSGINGAGGLVNSAVSTSILTAGFTVLTLDSVIGVSQSGGSLTLNGEIIPFANVNHAITKIGLGTLILTGADSSTGTININAGTLQLNGGSVAGDVLNAATFVYSGTGFGGRLTNTGTAIINVDFAPGNGMENDGTASIAPGVNVTLNGTLSNTGSLSMTGGTLTLNAGGLNINSGSISLALLARLNITGNTLTNTGLLSLDGALVSGPGTLANAASGYVSGTGTISSAFSNSGLLAVGSVAMTVTQAFINSGAIQLTAFNSALTGGAVANTGSIQGLGNISNAVTNTGTIEPIGGTLFIGGTLLNPAGGLIRVSTGNKLLVTQGLLASAGIVNLTGGTFDNDGQPMNNLGQISGWGTFATGGTGLDNNGSVTFSGGITTVNGPVTNENGKTIVVAFNPAIFTGLVTNNGGGTFNIISTTAVFAGGSSGTFGGTFTNNANSAFSEGGSGTVEVDGAPTLNTASSLAVNDSSTLRFKAIGGAAAIGAGVAATVNNGATLELAGSVSALSSGSSHVNITNNSSAAAGIVVSGTHQQVGNIDGSGATQVNAGSDLTANHIIQGALTIGGTASSPALVTIDASDASGNPLDQSSGLGFAGSLVPNCPIDDGVISSANLTSGAGGGTDLAALSLGDSSGGSNPSSVPEPSTLLLALLAVLGVISTQFVRNHFRCQTV
jgi:autotransporter-associated beta strand protein